MSDLFAENLPYVKSLALKMTKTFKGQDRLDAVQECIAQTLVYWRRIEGTEKGTVGNLRECAYYAALFVRSGRHESTIDPMNWRAQEQGDFNREVLNDWTKGQNATTETSNFKLDTAEILDKLPWTHYRVAQLAMLGFNSPQILSKMKIGPTRLARIRNELYQLLS